ncbi:DNA-binding protein H-NS [Kluyvera sp. 1366]
MRNIETIKLGTDVEQLSTIITQARTEERAERGLQVARRLTDLAMRIQQKELSGIEAAELLRQEAERYESEAQEAVH